MNTEDLVKKFKLIGCKVNIVRTGHDDYVRGFILNPEGCTIGRATIHRGELSHIKWYWKEYGDLVDTDFIMTQWRYMQHCGRVLSEVDYSIMVVEAHLKSREDRKVRLAKRAEVNASYPKKRKSIAVKNIRSFMQLPRKAPWCDFVGTPILEGDSCAHPSGESGVVIFKAEFVDPTDQWCVRYDDGSVLRLCLQTGDKGQLRVKA